jgi:hypothetical protein
MKHLPKKYTRKTSNSKTKLVFHASQYESNDGMLTTVWGPPLWHYLHTMSFNYPVKPTAKDKKNYRDFVLNLVNVLPCGKCRKNLEGNFRKLPLLKEYMKTRWTFSKYIFDLHELVNKMLKKQSGLTFEMVRDRYEHFRSRCTKTKKKMKKKTENGCTEPLTGEKSKCVLHIVPRSKECDTFQIDKQCEMVKIVH